MMKNYFVTFFINRSYNTANVCAYSENEAEKYIRENFPNAILIKAHIKSPITY